ncbi:hypothetical protein K2173_002704 [Erythroxylum novogranatense]|uniref:Protein SIEVE ELEMENT OCCLUSION C n=1 Tax=Erythroxylum novogranatense TaxID=1862640 RepID=A0AAV8SY51_9ROSI|nr:hypothetical protein K2173_002704 [Erythroxylum novogranatense]
MRTIPLQSFKSLEEDILARKLLLSHDPDGRRLDSELVLRAMENVLCYASTSEVGGFWFDANAKDDTWEVEVVGSQEKLGQIISRISCEMLSKCLGKSGYHEGTMILFDLLRRYGWDAKLVIILSAFTTSYGEVSLILNLYSRNPLAASVARLKRIPPNVSTLRPSFEALSLLLRILVDITKCLIKFEGMRIGLAELEGKVIAISNSYMYIAAYWVARSTLACYSFISDLKTMTLEQVPSKSVASATCELLSLANMLTNIHNHLRQQFELYHQHIGTMMNEKLLKLFQESHADNQKILGILLALGDSLPLKNSSTEEKIGVGELKDKIVILMVSKPELFPLEGLFQLVHQAYEQFSEMTSEESYKIVWIPISSCDVWTNAEEKKFNFVSNCVPWFSVRRPWALNPAVINFIKQVWNYKDDPLMVVLDPRGMVTNPNAFDMVLTWGAGSAYPFSSAKEKQLWEEEKWTIQLLVDSIDPLLTLWVKQGRTICIYGSDDLDWIRKLNAQLKQITSQGLRFEMVYVGDSNLSEHIKHVLVTVNMEMHHSLLTFTKLPFFWGRLKSIRRSILKTGKETNSDKILQELSALLDTKDKGWAIIGRGSTQDIIKLQGNEALECLSKYNEWSQNVIKLGLVGALRAAIRPASLAGPCYYSYETPYKEDLIGEYVECSKCKHPMKKYVLYK